MSGVELTEVVRTRFPDMRIIVVSGRPADRLPDDVVFFAKPYGNHIDQVLRGHR